MCSGQVWVSINSIIVIMVELRVYSNGVYVCVCVPVVHVICGDTAN